MPVSRSRPQFRPNARFVLNVRHRKLAMSVDEPVYFHDSENLKEECNIDLSDVANITHFTSASWAKSRGLLPCKNCAAN